MRSTSPLELEPPKRSVDPRATVLGGFLTLLCFGCATPPPEPLEGETLLQGIEQRAGLTELHDAEGLRPMGPMPLRFPARVAPDPRADAYWHLLAAAYTPQVRAMRQSWLTRRALEGVVGAPGDPGLEYRSEESSGGSDDQQLSFTLDLLSLIGLGSRPAARELAEAASVEAREQLEAAVWEACFAVDRARVRRHMAVRRLQVISRLLDESMAGQRRIDLLGARGRVGSGPLGRSRAVVAGLQRRRLALAAALATRRAELARASGLPLTAAQLQITEISSALIRPTVEPLADPVAQHLLETLPGLRAALLAYARSEAGIRAAAARWWPGLRAGLRLRVLPDDYLSAGILALRLPWPPAVRAEIRAAIEQRRAARQRVEDSLHQAMVAVTTARQQLLQGRESLAKHVPPAEAGSAQAWRAARAMLAVRDGAEVVETWIDALQLRLSSQLARVDGEEELALRRLAWRQAAGLAPGLQDARGRALRRRS